MSTRFAYQYVVLRCVPRPDREEFLNVGVVLHCQAADYLDVVCHVDAERLHALHPGIDVDHVRHRQSGRDVGAAEHDAQRRVFGHEREAIGRPGRVERHVGGARLVDGEQRDHQL